MSPNFAYTKSHTSSKFGNKGKMIGLRVEEEWRYTNLRQKEVDEDVKSEEEYGVPRSPNRVVEVGEDISSFSGIK
jgi:hypothetical protein